MPFADPPAHLRTRENIAPTAPAGHVFAAIFCNDPALGKESERGEAPTR
jgi:hypothetical protein